MKFEWDVKKNRANLAKHGIDFELASLVFHDPYLVSVPDERFDYDESRWHSIGLIDDVAVFVAHMIEGEAYGKEESIRIISARKATRREERQYFTYKRAYETD